MKQRCIVFAGTWIGNKINLSLKMSKDRKILKAILNERLSEIETLCILVFVSWICLWGCVFGHQF